jgi:hypothetical protein
MAGETYSYGSSGDVYLVKTDTSGNFVWSKNFGGTNDDWAQSVAQTNDGGYIVTGAIGTASAYDDVYLIKTYANGNAEWTKTFGGLQFDHGHSVKQTSDGGYIVSGHTASYGAGQDDAYLIKTDANGNVQ